LIFFASPEACRIFSIWSQPPRFLREAHVGGQLGDEAGDARAEPGLDRVIVALGVLDHVVQEPRDQHVDVGDARYGPQALGHAQRVGYVRGAVAAHLDAVLLHRPEDGLDITAVGFGRF
jgi:hypothetical protein